MVEILDNEDSKYKYNEEVTIFNGLYNGINGKFKKQEEIKGEIKYIIECEIDGKIVNVRCKPNHIKKKVVFKIPFVN